MEEAILTLRKLFLRSPPAHAALMAKIVGNYNMLCGAIGKEPDNELLRPIIAALQRLEGSSDDKDNQV